MKIAAKSERRGGSRFLEPDSCVWRVTGLARDGTTEPVSRDRFSGPNGDKEKICFLFR